MKTFKGNFATPTVQDWLQKAEKDLKGKSLEDLSWGWSKDLSFPPVYFESPQKDGFSLPPNKSPWTIGEYFSIESVAQSNKEILAALDMGLEGVHLHISQTMTEADWQILFDKIILSYITIIISIEGAAKRTLIALDHHLQNSDWDPKKLLIKLEGEAPILTSLSECKMYSVQFEIIHDAFSDGLAQQLNHAEQLLRNTSADKIFFEVKLSNHFYQNIIYLQALKILWQNILEANLYNPLEPVYILAKSIGEENEDDNTQKINGTIQAVSAVVVGVQYLEIRGAKNNKDASFNRRINRNIQHLLKLESFMNQVLNPTEGSYYFDQLTKELAETTWSKFQSIT